MSDTLELALRAARQHQLITVDDVRACGISAERWRRMRDEGWWVPVTPTHFRQAAVPLTFEMQLRAGSAWLGRDSALFGSTALRWLGVEVPEPHRAEFLVPRSRRCVVTWMTIHTSTRWDPRHVIIHGGVRTSTAARAIVDLATAERAARVLEQAIDSAVRLRRTSVPTLRREVHALRGTGRTGCALLRELLLDAGGESYLERRFLRLVREAELPRPQTQVVFSGSSTRTIRVDFLFDRIVVEVRGRLGHASDRDRQKDARRRNELQQQGFTILEFTTADVVDDPSHVLATLRRSLPVVPSSRRLLIRP